MNKRQFLTLKRLAKEYDYGSGPEHSKQVTPLSIMIYKELARLGILAEAKNDELILKSAALLHNIGLPEEPHNEVAFDTLKNSIPGVLAYMPLSSKEMAGILYSVLWHRGSDFSERGNIEIPDRGYVMRLVAIVRVADALDRSQTQKVGVWFWNKPEENYHSLSRLNILWMTNFGGHRKNPTSWKSLLI